MYLRYFRTQNAGHALLTPDFKVDIVPLMLTASGIVYTNFSWLTDSMELKFNVSNVAREVV